MALAQLLTPADAEAVGERLHELAAELYPIARSLTGDGVRETLRRIAQRIELTIHEVPSGTPVLDWTVPREWNVREAWIADPDGRRVVDFAQHNLHVLGYSVPVRRRISLTDLRAHLFTLPDQPDLIPYRTSYYNENWGFCLSQRTLDGLAEGEYEVCIDSTLADGHLTYGECVLPGREPAEVLVSAHVCHPSLANDNLSGLSIATLLACELARTERRLTYRFLFIPGTIGSITWLSRNEQAAARVHAGLVLTCCGDPGDSTYKRSRRGAAAIDRAMELVLRESGEPFALEDFTPWGYDERQYCSPGFNLPVGCLMRTPHGRFSQYHTSADDLTLITPTSLADTYAKCRAAFDVLERDRTLLNLKPKGEPQLGKRGLYGAVGGESDKREIEMAMLWVLNFSDGEHSLLAIADRSGIAFDAVARAATLLEEHDLLGPVAGTASAVPTTPIGR